VLSAFVVPPVLNSFTSKPESHTEGAGSFLAANFLEPGLVREPDQGDGSRKASSAQAADKVPSR
jgi:hypothetical protein